MKSVISIIKEATHNEVSRKKNGNIIIRRGYFYRNGDVDTWADRIKSILNGRLITFTEVSRGDIWKAFRGGATTANSSHFYLEIKV